MLEEAVSSSLPPMLEFVVGVFELLSLRDLRVVRAVLFAMLVRVRRVRLSHWPTILFFVHFSLAEKKRLQTNFVWFVDDVRVGCFRTWFLVFF
jgi:hypothetical protein